MESWHKGDFLQYRVLKRIPEAERKRKYGDSKFAPFLRRSKQYLSDAPLLFNGMVPVHTHCDKCNAPLEAYAKILAGRFTGIVEVEVDADEKQLVLMKAETTAKILREEFEKKLSHLQESCKHEKADWMETRSTSAHGIERGLVCLKCEKVLRTRKAPRSKREPEKLSSIFDLAAKSKMTKAQAFRLLDKMQEKS